MFNTYEIKLKDNANDIYRQSIDGEMNEENEKKYKFFNENKGYYLEVEKINNDFYKFEDMEISIDFFDMKTKERVFNIFTIKNILIVGGLLFLIAIITIIVKDNSLNKKEAAKEIVKQEIQNEIIQEKTIQEKTNIDIIGENKIMVQKQLTESLNLQQQIKQECDQKINDSINKTRSYYDKLQKLKEQEIEATNL